MQPSNSQTCISPSQSAKAYFPTARAGVARGELHLDLTTSLPSSCAFKSGARGFVQAGWFQMWPLNWILIGNQLAP